ncbi:MAG: sigma-54 interaction domain-containing protein [bacterium]
MNLYSSILDSLTEGVFAVDLDWKIIYFNSAAEKITRVSKKQALGSNCQEVLKADICDSGCLLKKTLDTGKVIAGKIIQIIDAEGNLKNISISTNLLKDNQGKVKGGVESFFEVSGPNLLKPSIPIIGKSKKISELRSVLPEIASSNANVLITGETGTGKEVFARYIHNHSRQADKKFIVVNCAAIPHHLLEAELFGYMRGAFTGAEKNKPGKVKLADKGTLFLDEIGEIPLLLQSKLLRFLEDKTFEPLGSTEPEYSRTRIISATNRNLDKMIENNEFRDDLFFRLKVIHIDIPPLRERKEDIPLLIDYFIYKFNREYQKEITGISDQGLLWLMKYDFPGNIRELENMVERSFVFKKEGLLEIQDLPEEINKTVKFNTNLDYQNLSLEQVEKIVIENALIRNNYNQTATAQQLGIHRTTLIRKMKKFNLGI